MIKANCIALLLLLFSANVYSGEAQGKVKRYWVHYFSDHFIFEVENKINRLNCDKIGIGRWAVDITLPKGKAIMSAVLTAKTTGATIKVIGTGRCDVYGDSEDISWIEIQ